jgi:hypothetical protein
MVKDHCHATCNDLSRCAYPTTIDHVESQDGGWVDVLGISESELTRRRLMYARGDEHDIARIEACLLLLMESSHQ